MHYNPNIVNPLNTIAHLRIQLMAYGAERQKLLDKKKAIWDKVMKKSKNQEYVDERAAIKEKNREIGAYTNKMNILVGSLINNYFGHDKAMNLAYEYLTTEIERDKGILENRLLIKEKVYRGTDCYMSPDGSISHDPNCDDGYISDKENQIQRLEESLSKLKTVMATYKSNSNKKINFKLKLDYKEDEYVFYKSIE